MTLRLLRDRLVVGALFLGIAMTSPPAVAETNDAGRNQAGFAVAGVALGMDFESVLKVYPTARIERAVVNCYNFGRPVSVPVHTRRTLRHRYKAGLLTLDFEPQSAGGGLSRLHYDLGFEPSAGGIRKLLDRFLAQYGPYDRILHRRKMEPAGRIVGFEWHNADGATLRVVLRRDYDNGSGGIRLSILARSIVTAPRPTGGALSLSCGKS